MLDSLEKVYDGVQITHDMAPNFSKNAIIFVVASVMQKAIALLYFAFVARMFGGESMGQYLLIVSFGSLFGIFADIGIAGYLTREIAKDATHIKNYFFSSLLIKVPLTFLTYGLVIISLWLGGYDKAIFPLVFVVVGVSILDMITTSIYSIFRGLHKLQYESISVIIFQVLISISGFLLVYFVGIQVKFLVLALALGSIGNFVYSFSLLMRHIRGSVDFELDKKFILHIYRGALPFFLLGLFTRLLTYFDPMLLTTFAGEKYVAFYGVAYKTTFALQFIPAALAATLYPAYTNYFYSDKDKLKEIFYRVFRYLLLFSLPLCFGIISVGKLLLVTVYGAQYETALPALILLACAIPCTFVSFSLGSLVNASFKHNHNVIMLGIAVVIYIVLNIILITKYQHVGTAIAALVTHIFLLIGGFFIIKNVINWRYEDLYKLLWKPLCASVIMYSVIVYASTSLITSIFLGGLVYIIVVWILKAITTDDIRYLVQSMKRV